MAPCPSHLTATGTSGPRLCSLEEYDRDTGITVTERALATKHRAGDRLHPTACGGVRQPRRQAGRSAVSGPRLKGYHFVVVFQECLDTVSEILTLFLQRGKPW